MTRLWKEKWNILWCDLAQDHANILDNLVQGSCVESHVTSEWIGTPCTITQMKWTGPFKVEEVISWTVFRLHIPLRWKIHPVFHASLLTTYKETAEHGPNFLQPSPDLINGEEEYEVEAVIGHQGKPRWWTFLIWWKGYSAAEDTWESEHNLGDARSLIEEYKIAQPKDFSEYNHHSCQKWPPLS